MNNFDDLFENNSKEQPQNQEFDKETWAAKKKQEREDVYALSDNTAMEVATDSDKFRQYLDVQSRFDRYSAVNALLITAQKPDAQRLGDLPYWKGQKIYIKKSELKNSIAILEPGNEYQRGDGSVGVSYNVKRIYDVSQAERRVVQPAVNHDDRALIRALMSGAPVPIKAAENLADGLGALYDPQQKVIFVQKGMDAADIFKSLSNELCHAELDRSGGGYNRKEAAFPAYCASYMLCKRHGFDVSDYHFSDAPDSLSDMEPQEIRGALSAIRDVNAEISGRMANALEKAKSSKSREGR